MTSDTITTIAVVGVASLIPAIITWYNQSKAFATRSLGTDSLPIKFQASPAVLAIIILNTGIVALWFYIPINAPNPGIEGWIFFYVTGVVWLFVTRYTYKKIKNSYVIISNETVEFKYGKKKKVVDRKEITSVTSANGYIIISTLEKRVGLMIPMMFKDSSKILLLLR